jgi:uncharacterized protein (DUF849 family)
VTWDGQVQAMVDYYNADATVLHFHARNPAAGHMSTDFDQYSTCWTALRKTGTKTKVSRLGYARAGTL